MRNTNISFIVPAYNCAKFLPDAVNSIFDGNFVKGDEIVIVDDASTDNTLQVAANLQVKYPQINIFRHHYNKGSAAAGRNTGIDNSINNLIFCLDADNVLCPNSIPKLKKYMLDKKADAAAFGELHYFEKNTLNITNKWLYKQDIYIYDAINNTSVTPCASGNYLFTKLSWQKAGRYLEIPSTIAYDSLAFGLYQLFTGSKMVTLPHTFYYHRYGYDSTFIRESKKVNSSLIILQILLPFIDLFNEKDVNYMLCKDNRYSWYNNLKNHPIRLKTMNHPKTRNILSDFFAKIINKLI